MEKIDHQAQQEALSSTVVLPPEAYVRGDDTEAYVRGDDTENAKPSDVRDQLSGAYALHVDATLQLMAAIRRADREEVYLQDGHEHLHPWLAAFLNIGYRVAAKLADVALSLEYLPHLQRGFEQGRISYDHLRALVQVATPETEVSLLSEAEKLSVGATFHLVDLVKKVTTDEAADDHAGRRLDAEWDRESRILHLYGRLPDEMGAKVKAALDRIARKLPREDVDGLASSMSARRADALCEMADAALSAEGTRPEVVLHIDADELAAEEGAATLEEGPNVSVETARRMGCDALVQVVKTDSAGMPMNAGRSRRTVHPRLRSQLVKRDRACRFPGCNRTTSLHAHHIQHWVSGGGTDLDNLLLLCPVHHRLVHEGRWAVRGVPPEISFYRPDGSPYELGPPGGRDSPG